MSLFGASGAWGCQIDGPFVGALHVSWLGFRVWVTFANPIQLQCLDPKP